MKTVTILLVIFCSSILAGGSVIDPVLSVDEKPGDWLRYDNSSAEWFSWSGIYRGVWFNLEDFVPGWAGGVQITETEMWFFHNVTYPWDTSDFYAEIWNGSVDAPTSQLDQVLTTAVHYSPVYVSYEIPITVQNNFWVLANTELSAGGWPSLMSDGVSSEIAHSFYTNDFIKWHAWEPSTGIANYFIAVLPVVWNLDGTTWGSLKTTF